MLLLDHNVPKRVMLFLRSIGVQCNRTADLGWEEKRNGELLTAAVEKGFTAILTNDQNFVKSAEAAFKKHPALCIVILTLPQGPIAEYLTRFQKTWVAKPPSLSAGKVVHWPE